LPEVQNVTVEEAKLTEYLLSVTHRLGRHKAAFFRGFGFSAHSWRELARALVLHANQNEVTRTEDSPFGTLYYRR
jgi:hypothetical protein